MNAHNPPYDKLGRYKVRYCGEVEVTAESSAAARDQVAARLAADPPPITMVEGGRAIVPPPKFEVWYDHHGWFMPVVMVSLLTFFIALSFTIGPHTVVFFSVMTAIVCVACVGASVAAIVTIRSIEPRAPDVEIKT